MITDKLKIYGDKENKECIVSLLEKCVLSLSLQAEDIKVYTESVTDKIENDGSVACVILGYEDKEASAEGVKTITYSLSDSRADVTALNIQSREQSVCFEFLHKVFMSRVFIPHTSGYTPKQVLLCGAVLLAWGVSADKTVETINELLK